MKIKLYITLLLFALFLFSCVKRDKNNPNPSITYEGFAAETQDKAYLTIGYLDGDGDIFAEKDVKNPNFYAWFYYKDANGDFVPAMWPLVIPNPPKPDTTIYQNRPLTYVIERPSDLSKDQPIKGRITITMIGWRSDAQYKNFKYKIYMVDQKGNKTNEIMTPEIVVPF